jgi:hypothetical protein
MRFFIRLIFIVLKIVILAMLVILTKVLDFHFLILIKLLLSLLLCCTVTFGRRMLSAIQGSNIVLLFWMTLLTMFGAFHYGTSLTFL